jgi:hypothetical protein
MNYIAQILGDIPVTAVYALIAAFVVSVLLQVIKKWLSIQSDKIITFILGSLSFLTVGFDALTQQVAQNPSLLGPKTFMLMGLATTVYRYAVKPASTLMQEVKELRERKTRVAEKTTDQSSVIQGVTVSTSPNVQTGPVSSDTFAE